MKILTLRFKNLNALKGEWFIDFRAEPFASNGLFAITGATGAGAARPTASCRRRASSWRAASTTKSSRTRSTTN